LRVLIATNGSSHAVAALHLGAQIAARGRTAPTILTVIRRETDCSPDAADAILTWARKIVQPQVPDVLTKVRIGPPATEIVREAEAGRYDLVVVGKSPNGSLLTRLLPCSTAAHVAGHAPCPVIVAKGEVGPIRRILLCDSGSEDPAVGLLTTLLPRAGHTPSAPSSGAAAPAKLCCCTRILLNLLEGDGEIVVLHVMSQMGAGPGVRGKQLRSDTEALIEERAPEGELLARDIETLARLGFRARAAVRHGLVVEEIVAQVQSEDYDLVAIGAHRGHGWQYLLLEDLAHRIVVELDRPILVVR
jgi:nucleotide-binding universal stress UspA family protein